MASTRLLTPSQDGKRYELTSPTALPKAGGFLWNQKMMIHFTCRGFATAQFMQPEPAKYSHAPNIEAKTFMQPEQNYYAHHPGRFVYVKDEETNEVFSAPHEPVRAKPESFVFSVGKSDASWTTQALDGLRVQMQLALPTHDVAELWTVKVTNASSRPRKFSVYPYFTIGYMSWMNQSAQYRSDLGGIVGSSIMPYQKAEDYFKNKYLKDKTYFLCETPPAAWEARQAAFEGEGGLHAPSAIVEADELGGSDAQYETPVATVQYRLELAPGETRTYRFLFGPALDDAEIQSMRSKYLHSEGFSTTANAYQTYIQGGSGCLHVQTPDPALDNFVNNWLPRQVFYHGDVNRLTTDPQTRNYLQDNMGMVFVNPAVTRTALLTALAQQEKSGAMPDGILLSPEAELKYINQVPHTDHCVWVPIALDAYLAETGDYALLNEPITDPHGHTATVRGRLNHAMDWLLSSHARDERGLSYIAQGDWCDPMNMVGYKGKGVSGWLTVATAYALRLWAGICSADGVVADAVRYEAGASEVNEAAKKYLWDGEWFARGITDDGVVFGVQNDTEGRIWLNPQAWAILGGAATDTEGKIEPSILSCVQENLSTPDGVLMFHPPFSKMREDVGRVTQKFPGQGENGAVYNHAAAFWIHALYSIGETDRAFTAMRQTMLPETEDGHVRRGQMPVYVPNYYRGDPARAGRSSQLFNTGTVAWVYRSVVEGLCGLKGNRDGLSILPQLPSSWDGIKVRRSFRGSVFDLDIKREDVKTVEVTVDGKKLPEPHISGIEKGRTYQVSVLVPGK